MRNRGRDSGGGSRKGRGRVLSNGVGNFFGTSSGSISNQRGRVSRLEYSEILRRLNYSHGRR